MRACVKGVGGRHPLFFYKLVCMHRASFNKIVCFLLCTIQQWRPPSSGNSFHAHTFIGSVFFFLLSCVVLCGHYAVVLCWVAFNFVVPVVVFSYVCMCIYDFCDVYVQV